MKALALVLLIASSAACVSSRTNSLTTLGARCDKDDTSLSAYGRPTAGDTECRDTSSGTLR